MQIQLTTLEFQALCADAGSSLRLAALQADLDQANADRDDAIAARNNAWGRHDTAVESLRIAESELREARREIAKLQEELTELRERAQPNYLERKLSHTFSLFRDGQKIYTIKSLREIFKGLGLKEAKEIVEGVFKAQENFIDDTKLVALSNVFRQIGMKDDAAALPNLISALGGTKLTPEQLMLVLQGTYHTTSA